ncbi:filamin-B [Centroberyx affinis]|uniref:filamin-B n=1 Tax=Centroberyx affinis TaxID=166261 RepID=UPI003A5BB3D5
MFSMESQFSPGGHGVCATECNLADDAPWKKIQKNTFTRWCNEHLRCVDRAIRDLQFDLNDGLTLIALLEVLSHKKMPRKYHTRPTFRQMRLDNVSVALEFLEQEKIKLVSIDSKAIVDGNMKLILGLVWTLILHYSISSHLLEDGEAKKQTPELRLLGWIQGKVPELPITNFNQDWMDGKALGALVDGLAPGLCPDWESWDEVQRADNAREAMQQADEWLGVPQVIAPEEIIDPCVDEQSIMTYLSMFPKAQLKPGAPLKPKSVSKAKACRASGRGLQPAGVRVGQVAGFKVDTSRAGPGHLEVHVRGPDGMDVPVKHKEDSEDFYFQYEPNIVGNHIISITWGGEHIFKSPFEVGVSPKAGPQMIRAWGPGLEHGVVEMSADFVVESVGATAGMLGFAIEGPSQARIECDDQDDGSCDVRFWPTKPGEYAVHVTCDEEEIEDSPFLSYINPNKKECYPHKVKVFGMGESQNGFILNRLMEFTVDARFAGDGSLGIQAQNIEGKPVSVDVKCKQPGLYTCFYTPTSLVKHTVFVTWGGVGVPGSPFRVAPGRIKFEPSCNTSNIKTQGSDHNGEGISLDLAKSTNSLFKLDLNVTSPENVPADANKVTAYGPGLEGGFVGTLADFTIDTNDSGSGQLSVTVDGPSPAKIQCSDNQDGSCTVTYLPAANGEHLINIVFQGVHIPGSPFHADIQMPFDPAKVVISGPGMKRGKVGEPCVVNIDCGSAGFGELSVEAVSETGQKAKTEVQKNKDGTCTVVYVPLTAGVYTLRLKYGGKVLANFPSEVIVDPAIYTSQVKLCGSGADGRGEAVTVEGPSDAKVSCTNRNDGCYDVQYTPSVPGLYQINITSGGEPIEGSPFKVPVKEVSDKSDVKISGPGLESGVCTQIPQAFTIDCSKTGNAPQSVAVMTPSGKIELVEVNDIGDGTYSLAYCPSMEGDHSLVVKYTEEEAFSSPFAFQVLPNKSTNKSKASEPGLESGVSAQMPQTFARGCEIDPADVTDNTDGTFSAACSPDDDDDDDDDDANKLKVSGPGLCAKVPQTFIIDCSKTGRVPESVAVKKPNGNMELVEVTDNGNGTYSVVYCPAVEGAHSLLVKYDDGEEFCSDSSRKVKVSVPGLESVCAQIPQTFTIGCSKTGDAPQSVAVMTPSGTMEIVKVTDNGDGTYSVVYSPSAEGTHSLKVKYADEEEFSNLSNFQVLPTNDANKLKVSGPGLESGLCVKVPQSFTIDCSKTGEAPESVAVMTPNGDMELVGVTDNGDGTYSVVYSPSVEGAHHLVVKYADEEEFQSPYQFQVLPSDSSKKMKVPVPGLESGVCMEIPHTFITDCGKDGNAPESVAIMTPSGHMELVEVTDNGDGTYSAVYSPSVEGAHHLVVKYAEENEFCSPYPFQVLPSDSSKKMKVSVPGLDSGVCARIPQTFTIGRSKTGDAPQSAAVMIPSGKMELVDVTDNGDGTYSVAFCPSMEGAYSIMVTYSDEEDFCNLSSFHVLPINDASKLEVSGPGLESGLCVKAPQIFTIDCSKTGDATEFVAVMTPNGTMELVEVTDNGHGTFSVAYSPQMEGAHLLVVKYAGRDEFCSPYDFHVLPTNDANKKEMESRLGVKVSNGKMELVEVTDIGDEKYSLSIEGSPSLFKYTDEEEFCSPHCFQTLPRDSSRKLKVSVPGLESGVCAQIPQTFTIGCIKTGDAPQAVAVMTPTGEMELLKVTDIGNGDYSVAYAPSMDGAHLIMVKYTEEDDFSSLSNFQVLPTNDDKKLKVSGPGLESGLCAKCPQTFTIDCSKTGEVPESVAVMTPSGNMELVEVTYNGDGTYSVSYSPSVEGAHSLLVKYADEEEFCSPYNFHVLPSSDTSKLRGSGSDLESKPCAKVPQTFTIDCSKTGEAPESVAMVMPNGKVELIEVRDCGDGKYTVAWSPSMDGSHSLVVKYADEDEYRCPVRLRVLSSHDAHKVRVSGPGLLPGLPASLSAHFTVDTAEAGEGQLSVEIVHPDGRSKRPRIHDNCDGTYDVSYVPDKVGDYKITIEYSGDEIPTSPYHVWAIATGDANKCIITGEEIVFVVNTQSAGMGKISCFVLTPDGTEVEADVTEREDGTFEICYTTAQPGSYIISASFGGESLFTWPFEVMGRDMKHGSYIPLRSVDQQNGLTIFNIVMALGLDDGEITGEVHMPSGSRAQAEVTDNRDGTATLMYEPTEEGLHQIHIKVNGATVSESPLQFYVNDTSKRELMAHGPGLVYGTSNDIAAFTIFNKDLLQGDLDIALEGPSKAEIRCLNNRDGTCTVTYFPTVPGDYNIFVRYNDEDITGSPFTAKIAGPTQLRSQVRFGKGADFTLDITEEDVSLLSVSITSPSGRDVSFLLKRQPDRHLGISFIPKEVGEHLVSVLKNGEHVANSPIPLTINLLEIGDASRVKVFGPGLAKGYTCEMSDFVVDTREAGYGGLSLAIEGPSNVEIQTEELEDGTCGVSFCPTEAGTYTVSVKFTDEHVPGSPFTVLVTESGHVTESRTHCQGAAVVANVGKTCGINLKKTDHQMSGLNMSAEDVSRVSPPWPSFLSDASKVASSGQGLKTAFIGKINVFSVDCSKAGTNLLLVGMHGPTVPCEQVSIKHLGNNHYDISYVVKEKGSYILAVKWGEEHIPGSPFHVFVP